MSPSNLHREWVEQVRKMSRRIKVFKGYILLNFPFSISSNVPLFLVDKMVGDPCSWCLRSPQRCLSHTDLTPLLTWTSHRPPSWSFAQMEALCRCWQAGGGHCADLCVVPEAMTPTVPSQWGVELHDMRTRYYSHLFWLGYSTLTQYVPVRRGTASEEEI